MAVIDSGSSSAGKANVDAGYNLQVALSNTPAYIGGVRNFSENDPGTITGTPLLRSPETSTDFRARVGMDTLLFNDSFNATAQNISNWKHAFTTMTMTQSSGFLNVNAAGTSTVSGNYAALSTWRYFPILGTGPITCEIVGQFDRTPVVNEQIIWGFGIPVAGATPIDGVWFEYTSAGLYGVIRYNSGAPNSTLLKASSITVNVNDKYVIVVGLHDIEFWINDVLYAIVEVPAGQGQPFLTTALPVFIQKNNTALVGSSPNVIAKFATVCVTLMDLASNQTWRTRWRHVVWACSS